MNGGSNTGNSKNSSPSSETKYASGKEPPKKQFCHLSKILDQRFKEGGHKEKPPPGQQQLQNYLQNVHLISEDVDPLQFWVSEETNYPLLSIVAVDILSIPASSAPIERVFSTAREATTGKRNRLTHQNLEQEVISYILGGGGGEVDLLIFCIIH